MVEDAQARSARELALPGVGDLHHVQWALRELQRAMDRGALPLARRAGLGRTDLAALDVIGTAQEEGRQVGPAEVAQDLGITTASSTALVDRLVAVGHVRRRPHPGDRRRVVLERTRKAERDVWRALQPLVLGMAAVERDFTEAELAVVTRYLLAARDVWVAATAP